MKLLSFTVALFFSFLFTIAVAAVPQGCVKVSNTYTQSNKDSTFFGSLTFSVETNLVTISEIAADLTGNWKSKSICVTPDNASPICVSNFSQSITFEWHNSTFLVQAYFYDNFITNEYDFGYGVIDEGSFSFPSGEMFSKDSPCQAVFINDTDRSTVTSMEQCCHAFKPVPQSPINAPQCNKFKSRTTIYNADDNYSIFATINGTYTIENHTLLAHAQLAGQDDWSVILWQNNYDECEVYESNNISCPFNIPNGDSKILLQMKAVNKTDNTMPTLLVGRMIFRDNQILMREGVPFTSKNDCDYFNTKYSPNQYLNSNFCCTEFSDE